MPDKKTVLLIREITVEFQEIPPNAAVAQQHAAAVGGGGGGLTAVALFDYEKQDDDEIGFEVNDVITDIEQVLTPNCVICHNLSLFRSMLAGGADPAEDATDSSRPTTFASSEPVDFDTYESTHFDDRT